MAPRPNPPEALPAPELTAALPGRRLVPSRSLRPYWIAWAAAIEDPVAQLDRAQPCEG